MNKKTSKPILDMKASLLTLLRDKKTSLADFRRASVQLAHLLAAEMATKIPQRPCSVTTPLGKASGFTVEQEILLIPILRSGLILLPPFLQYFPQARIGIFGIKREETSAKSILYYENIPPFQPQDLIFLLDPMIATGGSSITAIQRLCALGAFPANIRLISFLASSEGVQKLHSNFPDLSIEPVAVDEKLNSQKYIVPGLGDFGDRFFGTTSIV